MKIIRLTIVLSLLTCSHLTFSQDYLSSSAMEVEGLFSVGVKASSLRGDLVPVANMRAGWMFNNKINAGLDLNFVPPTQRVTGIYDDIDVFPVGVYAGIFVEPIFWGNNLIHLTVPLSFGWGGVFYLKDWEQDKSGTDDLKDGDYFSYIEPGLIGELNLMENIRLNLGLTGRLTSKLDLVSTDADTFRGLNVFMGVKIGAY